MSFVRTIPVALILFVGAASLASLALPAPSTAQAVVPAATAVPSASGTSARPAPPAADPLPTGRITGVGGIFFRSPNPKALMVWYRDVLGLKVEDWGGVVMSYDAPRHPPAVTVTAFTATSTMMAPSRREFMINFAVDDLNAFLTRITARGVTVLKRDDSDPYGTFAWILDPDGTKIELYQPKPGQPVG